MATRPPAVLPDLAQKLSASTRRDRDIRRVLTVAQSVAGLRVAWVSRFDDDRQVFTHVAGAPGYGPNEGQSVDLVGSYCVRVLDGRLPMDIPDVAATPEARDLALTAQLQIGAYAGIPLVGADGAARGMLCVTGPQASTPLGERQQRALQLIAQVVAALLDEDTDVELLARRSRVAEAVAGAGRHHVLQPIVDVRLGRAAGVEALTRFNDAPYRPDLWFAQADDVGLLEPLELAAAASALTSLSDDHGYVSINLSPTTIVGGGLDTLLSDVDRSRVVVEITEHAPVGDYEALDAALAPHRAAGLRVAIDDAGAGYASFRHILRLQPSFIKLDLSLVRDIHVDPVRQALAASLLTFAQTAGATVIAEGVETQDELDTLARLGVTLMQGHLLAHPSAAPATAGFPAPSRQVLIDADDLSTVLANALRHRGDLERFTRPLLDAVLHITGLETSSLALLDGDNLEHRFVRNAGSIDLPEGVALPWSQSASSSMQAQGLTWTNDAARTLHDRPLAIAHGVATFVTVPVTALDGTTLGSLCAGSTAAIYLNDAVMRQLRLIAHVLSCEVGAAQLR